MIVNPILYQQGVKLPELENPGTAADLLVGKQLVDQYGNPLTGTMPQKTAADLTASGAAVTVPAGYYPSQVSKSVATATHPKPTLSRSGGTVTAKHVQSAGYTSGGTTTETLTITTQAGKTVTPGTSRQTAVASGRLTTGAVYVAGDANLKAENIKSGVSIFGVTGDLAVPEYYDFSLTVLSSRSEVSLSYVGTDGKHTAARFSGTVSNKTIKVQSRSTMIFRVTGSKFNSVTASENVSFLYSSECDFFSDEYGDRHIHCFFVTGDASITYA